MKASSIPSDKYESDSVTYITDKIKKARSVLEIENQHKRNIQILIDIINGFQHKHSLSVLHSQYISLINMDVELRLMLVVITQFPASDRKQKLDTGIASTRNKRLITQNKLQEVISGTCYQNLKNNDNNTLLLSKFDSYTKQASMVLGNDTKHRYDYDGKNIFICTCFSATSNHNFKTDNIYLIYDAACDRIGISVLQHSYPNGIKSCSLSYYVSDTKNLSDYIATLVLSLSYFPESYSKVSNSYFSTKSLLSQATVGWINNKLMLRLKHDTSQISTSSLVLNIINLLGNILLLGKVPNKDINPALLVKKTIIGNTICSILIEIDIKILVSLSTTDYQAFKDRLNFLLTLFRPTDLCAVRVKINKMLYVEEI